MSATIILAVISLSAIKLIAAIILYFIAPIIIGLFILVILRIIVENKSIQGIRSLSVFGSYNILYVLRNKIRKINKI